MSEQWQQQEKEFLDYMLVSLHGWTDPDADYKETEKEQFLEQSRKNAAKNPGKTEITQLTGKVGLDHLDNLCKLMEQLGELRDQNLRLQKRVQYLEDMKTLQEMHQELQSCVESNLRKSSTDSLDTDMKADSKTKIAAHYADNQSIDSLDEGNLPRTESSICTLSSVMCQTEPVPDSLKTTTEKMMKAKTPHMRFKKPLLLKYRERSKSVGFDDPIPPNEVGANSEYPPANPEIHATITEDKPLAVKLDHHLAHPNSNLLRPKTKVSKWTRVKEAFRWEKVHVDSAKSNSKQPAQHSQIKEDPKCLHASSLVQPEISFIQEENSQTSLGSRDNVPLSKSSVPVARFGIPSRTSSSSSSLSECPLESEILKSFADAQELPLFKLEKRTSSPEFKSMVGQVDTESKAIKRERYDGKSPLSHIGSKRLHRQSTVSCDGNLGLLPSSNPLEITVSAADKEEVILNSNLSPVEEFHTSTNDEDNVEVKCEIKTPKRKISNRSIDDNVAAVKKDSETGDDETSFIASLRNQLKPINEWTSKWQIDLKNTLSTSSSECSRTALSVPSSPNRHQSFNFDDPVFAEATANINTTSSRDPSPSSAVKERGTAPASHESTTDKKHSDTSDISTTTPAEEHKSFLISSLTNPGQLLNTISPEFRKKVEAWERMKNSFLSETTESSRSKRLTDSADFREADKRKTEEKLPPAFKKKLAEWEIRKAVAGKSDQNVEELQKILPHDFNRKLQEWERMKAAGKPASPGLERQGSGSSKNRKCKSNKNREEKHVKLKSDVLQREKQKEKELQWLEKELQKIEREKQRLEREREKYIERETRLEKIREAMRQPQTHREICIRTSTGEFRFQGLSRKFTKKLWQWEEQKGIRPEASTIALLDGAYRPQNTEFNIRPTNGLALSRAKSESSVADLVSASVHSQPSSLSLNDAEAADFDRRLAAAAMEEEDRGKEIQGALLVEVEDVVEESSPIVDIPDVDIQAPVYSFTTSEVGQTIDSGKEKNDPEETVMNETKMRHQDSVGTERSYELLEENLSLLDRLRAKDEIVKYIEQQMNTLEGDMAGIALTQTEELDRLREEETSFTQNQQGQEEPNQQPNTSTIDRLKQKIIHLENKGLQLKMEKEELQDAYRNHCSQQVHLAHQLVHKMQQLQEVNQSNTTLPSLDLSMLQRLQNLSSQLLEQAQKLEHSIGQPQAEGSINAVDEFQDLSSSEVTATPTVAAAAPEDFSFKAQKLKEEFMKLRSSEENKEVKEDSQVVETEMSTADRKKIFVETRRLVFTPLEYNEQPKAIQLQVEPEDVEDIQYFHSSDSRENVAPWRRPRISNTPQMADNQASNSMASRSDLIPWRKKSSVLETVGTDREPKLGSFPNSESRSPPIRTTAPNIRRMIDKYHEKMIGNTSNKEKTTPELGPRFFNKSPPPSPVIKVDKYYHSPPPSPNPEQDIIHLQPIQLSKSLSTGVIGDSTCQENKKTSSTLNSINVQRSKSGHSFPIHGTNVVQPCSRNPSFFRKSPLDPSIDDLLQKYRGKRYVPPVPDLPRSPTIQERAVKLKQARAAFLSIGPGAIQPGPEESQGFDTSSETSSVASSTTETIIAEDEPQLIDDSMDMKNVNDASKRVTLPLQTSHSQTNSSMKVVQTLCKQSLFVDIGGHVTKTEPETIRSCPSSPALRHQHRSHPVSPSSRNSWLKQSKFFFMKPKSP